MPSSENTEIVQRGAHPSGQDFGAPAEAARPVRGARAGPSSDVRLPRRWAGLSIAAALLSIIACIVGLVAPASVYGTETPLLADSATAQDIVGLFVVAPLMLILAIRGQRGSLRSWLCWLGLMSFTVYNYAIYAFSIHFGPLFLVWVAVLGLSLFALIGGLTTLPASVIGTRFTHTATRFPGWVLLALGTIFFVLWLMEIFPDLLAGRPSTSAAGWNVPTNPVHVLDIAFFLPAILASGGSLIRRRSFGYLTAAGQLIFVELTCLPIIVSTIVANGRGHASTASVVVPIGILAVVTSVVLWRFVITIGDADGVEGPSALSPVGL